MNRFLELLATRPWLIADGAMGTSLFSLGLETGDSPELWNLQHGEKIRAVHRGFLQAGSDLILTNSFGGTSFRLALHDLAPRCQELNHAAAGLARSEADRFTDMTGRCIAVAGSIGPTGELFEPLGTLTRAAALTAFSQQAEALKAGGADVLWVETMSSKEEVEVAYEAAAATGLPVVCTMTFDTNACTMMGIRPEHFVRITDDFSRPPTAFGANCGVGPAELLESLCAMAAVAADNAVLVAKGNCGIPEYKDGKIHYHGSPETMADYAILARDAGARIIGGCCGSAAAHIAAMAAALAQQPLARPVNPERLAATLGVPWQKADPPPAGSADGGTAGTAHGDRRRRRRR